MMRATGFCLLAFIMTLGAGGIQADVLNLSDGSRIVGTIEEIDETQALMSGTFTGDLTVPRATIVSIETAEPVTVQFEDRSYLTGRLNSPTAGNVVLDVPTLGARPIDLASVRGVYRADPLELQRREMAVKVEAQANVGVNLTTGNSETENLHLDGQVVTRTQRNRYTLTAEYNQEESSDILVKENWRGLVKYDHFVSEKWFWFTSATFESDEFADLQLRAALAAGAGYQFFESDTRSLSVEAGPSYIDENFEVADDQSYLGARWAMNYDQKLWKNLAYFLYNEGLIGLEDTSDLVIRTRTGFSLNVTDHIIARIQSAIDWDKSPPEGTEGTDYEHSLTIGYRF